MTGRPPSWSASQLEDAISAYAAGATHLEVLRHGVPWTTLQRKLHERGVPMSRPGRPARPEKRAGTRRPDGYVVIYAPEHPWASPHGLVLEHRLVMERHLGRKLGRNETVHHRDHVRHHNDLSNLEVMDRAVHTSMHRRGRA